MPRLPQESLRWDAAQRACRDGDVKTLKWLFDNAQLFENRSALRAACESGAWGSGDEALLAEPFSTTDSIRLHTMLQTAAARGHVDLMKYLLNEFPARDLHILEWEVVINAIAQCSLPLLEVMYSVSPGFISLSRPGCRSPLIALFRLASEDASQFPPIVRRLLDMGAMANVPTDPGEASILEEAATCASSDTIELLRSHGAQENNTTLLRIAVCHDNFQLVDYLLSRDITVDDHSAGPSDLVPFAGTALTIAAARGSRILAERLIRAGADPSAIHDHPSIEGCLSVEELDAIVTKGKKVC